MTMTDLSWALYWIDVLSSVWNMSFVFGWSLLLVYLAKVLLTAFVNDYNRARDSKPYPKAGPWAAGSMFLFVLWVFTPSPDTLNKILGVEIVNIAIQTDTVQELGNNLLDLGRMKIDELKQGN